MKLATGFLGFVLSVGSLLAAQGPRPMGFGPGTPSLDELKSFLTLSDKQVTDLTALQTSFREAAKPIHEEIFAKEKELQEELAKPSPVAAIVGQLMADIQSLRNQIKAKRDALRPQAVALLSATQKTSLATLEQALKLQRTARQAAALSLLETPEDGGFRGPGGPGFPGGGGPRGLHR